MQVRPQAGTFRWWAFHQDGYIAGVCNFAEPRGDHGLYATPQSIYSLLDRNNLMALYAPVSSGSGTLLASRDSFASSRSFADHHRPGPVARWPWRPSRRASGRRDGSSTRAGVQSSARDPPNVRGREGSTRRMAWHPTHPTPAPAKLTTTDPPGKTEQTDLNLDPQADHDHFSHFEPDQPASEKNINAEDIPSAAGTVAEPSAKSRCGSRSGAGRFPRSPTIHVRR